MALLMITSTLTPGCQSRSWSNYTGPANSAARVIISGEESTDNLRSGPALGQ